MKKGAALLAGVLAAAAVLSGCGGQGNNGSTTSADSAAAESTTEGNAKASGEKVTISLLSWNTDEILGEFIAGFEQENPNIKIDLQYVPPVQQYVDKFSVLAASGQMTDMFYIAAENKQEVISKGVAEDISDMEIFSRIDPATSATYGKDGKIYGYSPDAWIGGIFYNKDLFDEAGLDYPTEDWTWKEELEAAQTLTKEGVYGTYAPVTYNELYKTVVQNGGALFDENGTPTLGSEENIEAFQWMLDKMLEYNVQPTPEQMSGKSPEDMFKNGEVAMIRTGSWMVTTFADTPFEWDIVQEPGNTQKAHHVFADAVVGSAAAKNKEAVWKFIKFMSTDSTAAEIRLDSSWDLPAVNDESVQEKYTSQEKPESREVIFDVMETGIMPPVVDHYSEVQNAINEELNRAIIGEQSGEEALQAAQKKVTDILK